MLLKSLQPGAPLHGGTVMMLAGAVTMAAIGAWIVNDTVVPSAAVKVSVRSTPSIDGSTGTIGGQLNGCEMSDTTPMKVLDEAAPWLTE